MNKKEKIRKFSSGMGFVILAILAAAGLVSMLLDASVSGADVRVKALEGWVEENGVADVRSCRFVSSESVSDYGRRTCEQYPQIVEFALFCDELEDFSERSLARRRWAYQRECELLDDIFAKSIPSVTDSVLVGQALLRKEWFGRMLEEEIPDSLLNEVERMAEGAWERLDSVDMLAGKRYVFDVSFKGGDELRLTFLSPADSLKLTLENINTIKKQ